MKHYFAMHSNFNTTWHKASLDRNYYIFSLSDPFSGVEKKIFKEIMHVHYVTYDHALAQEPLHRGS